MTIRLSDIWPIPTPRHYKVYLAWNRENQHLQVWARDKREWHQRQEY
jgi:hypothetical protein